MNTLSLFLKTIVITLFGWLVPWVVYKYYHFLISGIVVYFLLYFQSKNDFSFPTYNILERKVFNLAIRLVGKGFVSKLLSRKPINLSSINRMKINELKSFIESNGLMMPKMGTGSKGTVVKKDLVKFIEHNHI